MEVSGVRRSWEMLEYLPPELPLPGPSLRPLLLPKGQQPVDLLQEGFRRGIGGLEPYPGDAVLLLQLPKLLHRRAERAVLHTAPTHQHNAQHQQDSAEDPHGPFPFLEEGPRLWPLPLPNKSWRTRFARVRLFFLSTGCLSVSAEPVQPPCWQPAIPGPRPNTRPDTSRSAIRSETGASEAERA